MVNVDMLGEKIGNLFYDSHALERMQERGLFPSVIEDTVSFGVKYKLISVKDLDEAKGATCVYVKEKTAEILRAGRLGNRIIQISPNRLRKYNNLIVLTNDCGFVKTAYSVSDKGLNYFFKRYISL